MPNWKKVALSGSNVSFNQVSSSAAFSLSSGSINSTLNFQSNIDDLIENKYFDIDIENIINTVIDNENIIHISKKIKKQQDGGANIEFNKKEINNLIDIYSKKILSNIHPHLKILLMMVKMVQELVEEKALKLMEDYNLDLLICLS